MILICNIYSDSDRYKYLFTHFINHYYNLGVNKMIFICNKIVQNYINNVNDLYNLNIDYYLPFDRDMTKPFGLNGEIDSLYINLIKELNQCWYIPVDLDEFYDLGEIKSFEELKNICINQNKEYVISNMIDMIAEDRKIPKEINKDIPIKNQFPVEYNITGSVMKACSTKVILAKNNINVGPGHHTSLDKEKKAFSNNFLTRHYKWFGDVIDMEKFKHDERKKSGSKYFIEQNNLFESQFFNI